MAYLKIHKILIVYVLSYPTSQRFDRHVTKHTLMV